jgi:hypothetical protein
MLVTASERETGSRPTLPIVMRFIGVDDELMVPPSSIAAERESFVDDKRRKAAI